ncbi:phosphotransferase [Alkalihalobacillus sp. LMS6]|uniref:phosphotransferase n=1 Tax=Bacillaceae TaxID=186817 RepID=UPI000C074E6F|nr:MULTISPECIES: phosphotransferase [Bacillaceae]UTR07415.1 phosphotransferase [Alkalihalobacillus sp. LMS6]
MRTIDQAFQLSIRYTDKLTNRVDRIYTNDEKQFILKKKSDKERAQLEIQLLQDLIHKNQPVPSPIKTKSNEYIVQTHQSYYVVYEHLQGKHVAIDKLLEHTHDVPSKIGSALAKLDNALLEVSDHHTSFRKRHVLTSLYGNIVPFMQKEEIALDVVHLLSELSEGMQCLKHLPTQLIHRDPHYLHFLFDDHQVSGVIDLELVEENVRILDPCYFATSILNDVFSNPNDIERWFPAMKGFFRAYHQENPFTIQERKALWYTFLSIEAVMIAFFSHDEERMEKNRAMFYWLYENKQLIDELIHLR